MSTNYRTRLVDYNVPLCPRCRMTHAYQLEVHYTGWDDIILFGGRGSAVQQHPTQNSGSVPQSTNWDVDFICSKTNAPFRCAVSVEPRAGENIVGVSLASNLATQPSTLTPASDFVDTELHEWVKASSTNARDFCKTMMTTATGAIPLFFAVLKYLGAGSASSSLSAWLGVVPPSIFLVSTILFMLALRPQYASVNRNNFNQFRTRRFKFMNGLILIGTSLFVLGVALAIIVFIKLI